MNPGEDEIKERKDVYRKAFVEMARKLEGVPNEDLHMVLVGISSAIGQVIRIRYSKDNDYISVGKHALSVMDLVVKIIKHGVTSDVDKDNLVTVDEIESRHSTIN